MDALSRMSLSISLNQQPLFFSVPQSHSRPRAFPKPISAICFPKPPQLPHLKITSSIPTPNPKTPTTTNPFSMLKTPLSIAVASAAIFLAGLSHRPLPAIASEPVPAVEETENRLDDDLASGDVQALKSLMEAKIKDKKLAEAVEVINKLVELQPQELEWPLLRAHMYTYMGEMDFAKGCFEDILAKDPFRVEAYHGLVMAVSQGEEGGEGLDEVTKRINVAIERSKKEKRTADVRDFKLLTAQIRVIEGNYNEALRIYQELVKEEPTDFRPYLCQGIIYTLLRDKDEAEKQFAKYKRLVPQGHPYARYFDDNMLATKVFSQMAENERVKMDTKTQ